MRELYIICLHDLEDLNFFGTEDHNLFIEAQNANDLMEWVWTDENQEQLEELGDDITGISVLGFTYGLQY